MTLHLRDAKNLPRQARDGLVTSLLRDRAGQQLTDQPCRVYRLSAAALQTMKRDEPDVAADFYEFMVRIVAERVVNCNKSIRALSE